MLPSAADKSAHSGGVEYAYGTSSRTVVDRNGIEYVYGHGSGAIPSGLAALTAPITTGDVLSSQFDRLLSGGAREVTVEPGANLVRGFDLARGDTLDLTKLLAGAPLAADFSNTQEFIKVLGYADPNAVSGAGVQTVLQVSGPGGQATIHLEGSGKLELSDLLKHHSLILPPQH